MKSKNLVYNYTVTVISRKKTIKGEIVQDQTLVLPFICIEKIQPLIGSVVGH